jgi:chromosome segregation ATPase
LGRRLKELEGRMEDVTARKQSAESDLVSLKERAKSAEQQNTKLHAEMKVLAERMGREEEMMREANKDKEAIRNAAGSADQLSKMEKNNKRLETELETKRAENGDLTKEVSVLMQQNENLKEKLSSTESKLADAERTRDLSIRAAQIAAKSSSKADEGGKEQEKEVVGDLLVKNNKLEESLAESEKSVAELTEKREKLAAAVKELKSKLDAAQKLKKMQGLKIENLTKEVATLKKGGAGGGGGASSAALAQANQLQRGAEIERDASEQKAAIAEAQAKKLRAEIEQMEQRVIGHREKFQIRIKQIETDVRKAHGDAQGDAFAALRAELEAANNAAKEERRNGRDRAKGLQVRRPHEGSERHMKQSATFSRPREERANPQQEQRPAN